jgi:hypothetical protein
VLPNSDSTMFQYTNDLAVNCFSISWSAKFCGVCAGSDVSSGNVFNWVLIR